MKSLKQIVKTLLIIILITLLVSILFNFIMVRFVTGKLNSMNNHIQDINEIYTEMNMPIRVFDNVLAQPFSNDPKDEEHNTKLYNAFETNRKKITNDIEMVRVHFDQLNQKINIFSKNKIIKFITGFDELKQYSLNLDKNISELKKSVSVNLKTGQLYNKSNINPLKKAYGVLNGDLENLTLNYNRITKNLIDKYILIISLLFSFILFGVLILILLLLRILGRDMKYVLKSFNMLNIHDHDEAQLPKLNSTFLEEKYIGSLVTNLINEQKFIDVVKTVTSTGYIIDDILEDLFYTIQTTLKTDRVGVAFIDYKNRKIIAEHGISNYGEILLGPGFEASFENTSLFELIESRQPIINNNLEENYELKPESPSLNLIIKEGIKSNMIFPLTLNQSVFAFMFFSSRNKNNYDDNLLEIGKKIASEVSTVFDKTYLTKTIFSKITNAFADLVDQKDNETGGHIIRMVSYSTIIAKSLLQHEDQEYRVTNQFVREIQNNASVHDIGKVGIPDEILKKPGKLGPDQWTIMKTHSSIGGDIFANLKDSLKIFNKNFYEIAENIARCHHEKWDGTGYPAGLSGKDIPLEARIVAIADVFDALTSERVYKKAFSFEKSAEIINESSGTHFDPVLVKVFNIELENIRKVYDNN